VILAGVALPFVGLGDPYTLQLIGNALALGIWVMGLDYLVGYTGCVSFGHAAWLAVGAYASGYLFLKGWDVVTTLVVMVAIVAALSALMGAVATRTGGLAFSIITLAEGVVIYTVITKLDFLGGGVGLFGLPLPKIAGMTLLDDQVSLYFFALALALLSYLALRWLVRSPFGGFCQAVRDDETRARSIGVEVQRHQILAFITASVVAGIGGMAFVVLNGGIGPAQASWSQSGLALVMLIIGGVGTLYGGVIGAFIYVLAQNYLISNFGNTWQVYLGALFVILVLMPPGGIAGGLRVAFNKLVSSARRSRQAE
jgi:branched-chain amino acid transport system permease protein